MPATALNLNLKAEALTPFAPRQPYRPDLATALDDLRVSCRERWATSPMELAETAGQLDQLSEMIGQLVAWSRAANTMVATPIKTATAFAVLWEGLAEALDLSGEAMNVVEAHLRDAGVA